MIQYLYVCLVLGLVADSQYSNTTKSDSIKALFELLNHAGKICRSMEWCTVQISRRQESDINGIAGCCKHCSCESSCLKERNCCPDWKLRKYFIGEKFKSVSEFIYQVEKNKSARKLDTRINYEDDETNNCNVSSECVVSSLFHSSLNAPRSSMYKMVTQCSNPDSGENDRLRCKANIRISNQSHMDDFRPVQSLDTGIVYRNKYCFKCNKESNSTYEEWDIYVAEKSAPLELLNDCPFSHSDLISYVIQRHFIRSLLFEPSKELRQVYPPQKCINVDIDACANDNTSVRMDMKHACNMYLLPFYIRINGSFTVINNMACSECNGIHLTDRELSQCHSYMSSLQYSPFFGKLPSQPSATSGLLLKDVAAQTAESIQSIASLGCDKGFIHDPRKLVCRQIYCPCGMLAYDSNCIPIYQETSGKGYAVYISVKPRDRIKYNTTLITYDETLMTYFETELAKFEDSGHHVVDIALWKLAKKSKTPEHIAYITLWPQSGGHGYVSVIEQISLIARGMKHLEFEGESLRVEMSVHDAIQKRRSDNDITDPIRKQTFRFVTSRTGAYQTSVSFNFTRITSCHFCYRVEVTDDDYTILPPFVFRLRQTRNVVWHNAVSNIMGTKRLLFCVNEVLQNTHASTNIPNDDSCCDEPTDTIPENEPKDDGDQPVTQAYHLAAIFLILIIIAVVSHAVCISKHTERANEERADNTEMVTIVNTTLERL